MKSETVGWWYLLFFRTGPIHSIIFSTSRHHKTYWAVVAYKVSLLWCYEWRSSAKDTQSLGDKKGKILLCKKIKYKVVLRWFFCCTSDVLDDGLWPKWCASTVQLSSSIEINSACGVQCCFSCGTVQHNQKELSLLDISFFFFVRSRFSFALLFLILPYLVNCK